MGQFSVLGQSYYNRAFRVHFSTSRGAFYDNKSQTARIEIPGVMGVSWWDRLCVVLSLNPNQIRTEKKNYSGGSKMPYVANP